MYSLHYFPAEELDMDQGLPRPAENVVLLMLILKN
jgi:hypothetical protein